MKELGLCFNGGKFDLGDHNHRYAFSHDPQVCFAHFKVGQGDATVMGGLICGKLYYAVSLCSPVDNFNKSLGRLLALRHFDTAAHSSKRGVMCIDGIEDMQPAQALEKALERFLRTTKHLPAWARGKKGKLPTVEFRTPRRYSEE